MKNCMLDLETMGTSSNAAIVAIGAVLFDETGLGETFYRKVSLESSMKAGFSTSSGSIIFWLQQPEEARKEIYDAIDQVSIEEALYFFRDWIERCSSFKVRMWGNGSDFDNNILGSAYDALKIPKPWYYSNNRCFRTLKNLGVEAEKPSENLLKHHALEDAIWQAKYAINIFKTLHGNF
jgi:hypothetical protein